MSQEQGLRATCETKVVCLRGWLPAELSVQSAQGQGAIQAVSQLLTESPGSLNYIQAMQNTYMNAAIRWTWTSETYDLRHGKVPNFKSELSVRSILSRFVHINAPDVTAIWRHTRLTGSRMYVL